MAAKELEQPRVAHKFLRESISQAIGGSPPKLCPQFEAFPMEGLRSGPHVES